VLGSYGGAVAAGGGGSARFSPVVVSRMAGGLGEWTTEQAVDLLRQGYGVDRVAKLTGFDRRWVTAQHRRLG
jgi:hypothetical protein